MLGKEAAMACTEAVEEVISEHYNDQLREVIHELPEDSELREVCVLSSLFFSFHLNRKKILIIVILVYFNLLLVIKNISRR